jgi:hypothetical protein
MKITKVGRLRVTPDFRIALDGFEFDAQGGNVNLDEIARLINEMIARGASRTTPHHEQSVIADGTKGMRRGE